MGLGVFSGHWWTFTVKRKVSTEQGQLEMFPNARLKVIAISLAMYDFDYRLRFNNH